MEPIPKLETSEASSTTESPSPAAVYSPHTQGFPPTSQPSGPINPFWANKKPGGLNPQVRGLAPANPTNFFTTLNVGSYVLRPSKLEAGIGTSLFSPKYQSAESEPKETNAVDEESEENSVVVVHPTTTTAESGDDVIPVKEPLTGSNTDNGTKSTNAKTGEPKSDETSEKEVDSSIPIEEKKDEEYKGECDSRAVISQEATAKETDTPATTQTVSDISKEKDETPTSTSSTFSLSTTTTPIGFVFGSNLNDRVENVTKGLSNGEGSHSDSSPDKTDTLKRKFESPGTITTGEEDESNVMQTTCRLFAFDGDSSSWIERGRGLIRLNDRKEDDVLHSRLIVRTKGSLRVMLNTPVFSDMLVERSSEKCVKITGHEDGVSGVKVFLIQCSPADAETLHTALEWRVRALCKPTTSKDLYPETKVTIHQGHFDNATPPKKHKQGD